MTWDEAVEDVTDARAALLRLDPVFHPGEMECSRECREYHAAVAMVSRLGERLGVSPANLAAMAAANNGKD